MKNEPVSEEIVSLRKHNENLLKAINRTFVRLEWVMKETDSTDSAGQQTGIEIPFSISLLQT